MSKRYRTESRVAGVLFIIATAATMASQMIVEPILDRATEVTVLAGREGAFRTGVLLEVLNALASAGIAIALFPILWCCVRGLAVAYAGLRTIEASTGIAAVCGLLLLLSPDMGEIGLVWHDWAFLLLLLVFSTSACVLYPVLFVFRLVPRVLSVWGLIGGLMLAVSVLLILFGRIEFGSMTDLVLSLPIWINEMALALWLIFRGVDMSALPTERLID
ncbi:DUF4386 domain-containing protein [Actibacterium lipolyticum]|uniref:DUF4386 domain-containing protein n=1 Tax=Actibacterium lipolyticum TaxID=1524263 RepID=A0A238JMI3_9RHOB|nr:DUF4386 domain-containing protein [Actibacterium lipolyticum]SMX31397.1 hypothetical protein COL8621_00426 [Actibacterium lipolyticum]